MGAVLENDSYVEIQVISAMQGQFCYMNLDYMSDVEDAVVKRSDALQRFLDGPLAYLQGIMVSTATILTVSARQRGVYQSGMTTSVTLNVPGLVEAEGLPVWDTFSFRKLPDTAGEYVHPSAVWLTPFKYGRIAVSGIPETFQEDGVAEASAATALNNFAGSVLELEAPTIPDGTSGNLWLIMNRYKDGETIPFQKRCDVLEVIPNRIGTQLTRKR